MSYYAGDYEVAVIGAGHAGCEAALACSRENGNENAAIFNKFGMCCKYAM